MPGVVLDASVVLAVVLQEGNRRHAAEILASVAEHGATVPSLWHLEVGNALLMAERRRLISAEEKSAALRDLARLPITVDGETAARAWREALSLGEQYRLTLYDAAYLELSLRLGLVLATFDAAIQKAARSANVALL
jgi:predicted nucleic acid-binding protein